LAKKGADNSKLLAAVSYLSIIGLIVLLVEKKDKFVQFHAKQGTGLFAIELLIWIIGSIIWALWPIINVVNIVVLVVSIYGIILALQEKETKIPVINELGEKVAEMLNVK